MTVKITKPAINLREKLTELDKPSGLAGEAILRADTPQEVFNYIGAGRRNLIINGGFDVWQRGTSWTSASNGQYTVDRWQTFGASMTCNIDRSTDVPANQGFKYSVKVVRTANDLPFLRQPIEDFSTIVTGRDWTASFWAKADTACTISVDLGDTGSTTVAIGTTWQRYTVYFPSTLTPTYTALDFQSNSSDTPMYITGVQLELGSVATPFEHRSYGEELALCQRYYQRITPSANTAHHLCSLGAYQSLRGFGSLPTPVSLRASPTVTFSALEVQSPNLDSYGMSSISAYATSTNNVTLDIRPTNSMSVNVMYQLRLSSGGHIDFDAEL